jgi:hypothetical protein
MDLRDRKQALHEAMDQLDSAIDNIRVALRGTSLEGHANAYIIGHLRSWVDSDNSFNMGIQQYIDRLDEEDDNVEDED